MKGKAVGIDSCVEHLDIFKEEANKLENSKNVEVKTICGYYPLKETILKGEVSTVLASLIFHFLCPEDLRKGLTQVLNKLFQCKSKYKYVKVNYIGGKLLQMFQIFT